MQSVKGGRGGVYWQARYQGRKPAGASKIGFCEVPKVSRPCTGKICKLDEEDAWQTISRIPAHRASDVSKQLAHAIVCFSVT